MSMQNWLVVERASGTFPLLMISRQTARSTFSAFSTVLLTLPAFKRPAVTRHDFLFVISC